jgi:hypothetical protein
MSSNFGYISNPPVSFTLNQYTPTANSTQVTGLAPGTQYTFSFTVANRSS